MKKPFLLPLIHKKHHERLKTSVDIMSTTNSKPLMFGTVASRIKYWFIMYKTSMIMFIFIKFTINWW